MTYLDFFQLAKYANKAWNGCYSMKEIAENAKNYKIDFDFSVKNGEAKYSIYELLNLLKDDNSLEAEEWYSRITTEIKKGE